MPYEVRLHKRVLRVLAKLPESDYIQIIAGLESLRLDPRPRGCRKLQSNVDAYRIRVGNFRIIYEVLDRQLLVHVIEIGDRKEVYR